MSEEQIRKQVLQILVDYHNEDIGNDAADKIIAIMKEEQDKFDKVYASRKAEFESGIRVERERIMTELPEKLGKAVDEIDLNMLFRKALDKWLKLEDHTATAKNWRELNTFFSYIWSEIEIELKQKFREAVEK